MRKDIKVSAATKDIVLSPRDRTKDCPFRWVDNELGSADFIYGEIEITDNSVGVSKIMLTGARVLIPYTPVFKRIMVRFLFVNGEFLPNPKDGSCWFPLRAGIYGRSATDVYASRLMEISWDAFYIRVCGGFAEIYNGDEVDFEISEANRQNANMLLECVPTNNYRYPLSGVGLIRWVNSNIIGRSLSRRIRDEFQDDGVSVVSASYDHESMGMSLDLDTTKVDMEE